jgi:kinesin family protein 5
MPTETVKVCARFRPRNKIEELKNENPEELISLNDDGASINITMEKGKKPRTFTFDVIFPTNTTQAQVFEIMGKNVVDNVLNGFNSTLFAYGQTGAGKTFTLVGKLDKPDLFGVIPRAGRYLFECLEANKELQNYVVKMNVCEIYLEKLKDLLKPSAKELQVRVKKNGSTYIEGIHEEYVKNLDEVFNLMNMGFSNRSVASTNMNAESSRSHCVFCFKVKQTLSDGQIRNSRLYVCDLAGSERVAKTGAKGSVFEEAKAINASLSALGNVINALSEGAKHMPYRDSKLTFLLKDSLAGNTKTVLFIAATLDSWNIEETVSTMRFAERAKKIKNKVICNRNFSPAQMKKIVAKQKEVIIEACELFQSMVKCQFQTKKCQVPTAEFLSKLKSMLKEEMPTATELKVDEFTEADAKAMAASNKKKDTAKKDADGDEEVAEVESDDEEEITSHETHKMGGEFAEAEAKFDNIIKELEDDIKKKKIQIMRNKDTFTNLEKKLEADEKEMMFFQAEYEKLPPKQKSKAKKKVVKEVPKTEEELVAKFKRDLRVYKYTLDLTRKEWKKNQTLALEKMNAHRKVIAKYKDDKVMLLNIVSDLESKLNEANRRLVEGQQQQKKANQMLGYDVTKHKLAHDDVPVPVHLHDNITLDSKQSDALAAFKS